MSFEKIGGSRSNDWESLIFNDFIRNRKSMGKLLEKEIEKLFDMINKEEHFCYESQDKFAIHVPRYSFSISGPKIKYSFPKNAKDNIDTYFIRVNEMWGYMGDYSIDVVIQ